MSSHTAVLWREDFTDFAPGPFPCDYSPLGEYHVPPIAGSLGWLPPGAARAGSPLGATVVAPSAPGLQARGRWREASIYHGWQGFPNWQVVPFAAGPVMAMTRRRRETHALLLTGDELWTDYQVAVLVRLLSA